MKLMVITMSAIGLSGLLADAENLLQNGDFEQGTQSWSLFAPDESQLSDCGFTVTQDAPHGDDNEAKLSSSQSVRYGIVNYVKDHDFEPGQRFRVSAWVKAGEDFVSESGTPGYILRVTMYSTDDGWENATNGSIYLGTDDRLVRVKDVSSFANQDIPQKWTKLEAVFEISPDTAKLNVSAFVWEASGSFYVDDVVLELVSDSTRLTPEQN